VAVSHFFKIITNYFYINALLLILDFLKYLSSGGDFGIKQYNFRTWTSYGSQVSLYDSVFIYSESGGDFGVKQDNFRNWTSWLRGEPL
jgi:hypothetical protein